MDEDNQEELNTKNTKKMAKMRRKELGISCMLNTEVGAVLAVIRRPQDSGSNFMPPPEEQTEATLAQSLKSLRGLIFNPHQEWRMVDPLMYLSPFLDVVHSEDVPATATSVGLSSILKILKQGVFDDKTLGAKEAMDVIVAAITSCRLERTDPVSEDAVLMKILQVMNAIMKHPASILLTDQAVCTIVNTCFQVVQQSASRSDLLQRTARYAMHDLVQTIFARLPEVEGESDNSESETEEDMVSSDTGYGIRSAADIFHFLCSLMNVMVSNESDGGGSQVQQTADEDVQLFALVLINSAMELGGDSIGRHPKLLRMIQDDLFHHMIHYGSCCSPLVFSMICSSVLNIYHFLRKSIRLQLESFFSLVLFKVMNLGNLFQLQELAVEGIINFCRQPMFILEAYVNYDCDPTCRNVFEDIGKLLCKYAFPTGGALTTLQIQAFEGLVVIIHNIADNIDKQEDSSPFGPYPVELTEYRPFWEEKRKDSVDLETWVDHVRVRKAQKRKILIAANHFNRDEKKGLEYLKLSRLISNPPDPKGYAYFFRYTLGLDKTMLGEYLGDPDDFHLQVLREFTSTFGFAGMVLDIALRSYLETFRLPGESQKIQRILEAFADKYFEQQSSELFANKDTLLILCYSLIMLNTDQHNHQVKKKMTEEEFIRNNRGINNGKDLPRECLSELFQSISTNAITIFSQSAFSTDMNPSKWIELINRSKHIQPYTQCEYDRRLGRDMFASIAGPSVAAISAIFEHSDEEEILHECIEAVFSIGRIAQYKLEDTLDELLSTFCKFTTLLNPYASVDETLYGFSHDTKPRMATLAVFTIANSFGDSIRGSWRNIIDCLLKLKKLNLLPPSVLDVDTENKPETLSQHDSGPNEAKPGHNRHTSSLIGRFSQFMSIESVEESLQMGLGEYEQNQKVIQQCRIGFIFSNSSGLPEEALLNLGRSLIFSAAGKGKKFSTPVEEEETVIFCWDVLLLIISANIHRFATFWPQYHDYLLGVAQFPLFSPLPFAEKAMIVLVKVCIKLLSSFQVDKFAEELMFRSINLVWKLDKEVLESSCEFVTQSISRIITEYPANLQTGNGWKTVLHLLSITGRNPSCYEQGVEALITLMSDSTHVSRTNYPCVIDCAFSFIALKNTPLDKNIKIMDLMAESVKSLITWYKSGYSDPGSSSSMSMMSVSGTDPLSSSNFTMTLFIKLGEAFRKTSLARREEIRNHAIISLQKSFSLAEELYFTPSNCINCFNLIVFAMVDDVHEKMIEYSRRENAEREMRSMEGTLRLSMELLIEVFLQLLKPLTEGAGFRTFWLGILRRMDTCMKADLGPYGVTTVQEIVPDLLRKMILHMKKEGILVQGDGDDDLWEITYIQIQWIAPSLKDELFPDEY
ncbi:ARF guanine-nucleotide exchange factor GNL2 [Impatiens glandulifera]|uniref:ARF guanine-nucleotide exchange factor GNL2 n=1 Tax=Impatiens glandulifera TaxID=253017 RepID=UPI001FB12DE9|nr:ARF guanine-nucleotide exchange factor GNL2 [Impatiens glandulifera]